MVQIRDCETTYFRIVALICTDLLLGLSVYRLISGSLQFPAISRFFSLAITLLLLVAAAAVHYYIFRNRKSPCSVPEYCADYVKEARFLTKLCSGVGLFFLLTVLLIPLLLSSRHRLDEAMWTRTFWLVAIAASCAYAVIVCQPVIEAFFAVRLVPSQIREEAGSASRRKEFAERRAQELLRELDRAVSLARASYHTEAIRILRSIFPEIIERLRVSASWLGVQGLNIREAKLEELAIYRDVYNSVQLGCDNFKIVGWNYLEYESPFGLRHRVYKTGYNTFEVILDDLEKS